MVVFGGDENVGVERGNFLAPALRMGFAVLMHDGGRGLIEEWQLEVLDIDNFKLRVVAAFQKVVHPGCDGRGFPSRSRTADDDSNLDHLLSLPVRSSDDRWLLMIIFLACFSGA